MKKQEKKKIPVALKRKLELPTRSALKSKLELATSSALKSKLELPTRNATMSRGQKPIKSFNERRNISFIRRAIQIKRREKFKI
jgi:hypothetical protein